MPRFGLFASPGRVCSSTESVCSAPLSQVSTSFTRALFTLPPRFVTRFYCTSAVEFHFAISTLLANMKEVSRTCNLKHAVSERMASNVHRIGPCAIHRSNWATMSAFDGDPFVWCSRPPIATNKLQTPSLAVHSLFTCAKSTQCSALHLGPLAYLQ